MTLERRQAARNLNIRRRFQALTSQELVLATKLQKLFLITVFRAKSVESDDERERLSEVAHLALRKYCNIIYINDADIPRPIRLDRRIGSFTPSQCWNFFETRQEDLFRPGCLEAPRNMQTSEWICHGWRRNHASRSL